MPIYAKGAGRRMMLGCVVFAVSVAACAADDGAAFRGSVSPDMNAGQAAWIAGLGAPRGLDYSAAVAAAAAAAAEESGTGYRWDGPPAATPDWRGIGRDTMYFVGYQFAAIGVLYVLPSEVSGWSEEQKEDYSFESWKEHVGDPVWDEDLWWINYVLHPYWGAAYYISARERGLDQGQSFLYSALLSTLYEFGVEAMFEEPSFQDLISTPVGGYLVGQFLFAPIRERIRAQPGEPGWAGKAVLVLTDPLGVVNAATDRLFGVRSGISLRFAALPAAGPLPAEHWNDVGDRHGGAPGSVTDRGWGLQLRATW